MFYTRLQVTCATDFSEILMAEIAEAGFDSFMETETGFEAFAENEMFDREQLAFIQEKYKHIEPLLFSEDRIPKKNWNEEWEKNLQPIVVEDKCLIRAEFHKADKEYPYEIIITPKMSFGTGHHQTTYLMISNQMKIDHLNKRVMDAGCGTAILSIMAAKRGASIVEAFDIDEWSAINGKENITNNHCVNIHIHQGKLDDMEFTELFDLILANINKNVLLNELKSYSRHLVPGGKVLLSGFYTEDIVELAKEGSRYGLLEQWRDSRENWAALLLEKNS